MALSIADTKMRFLPEKHFVLRSFRQILLSIVLLALAGLLRAEAETSRAAHKDITEQDYKLWHTLAMTEERLPVSHFGAPSAGISGDGRWIAYQLELGPDSPERCDLVLRSLVDDRVYTIPNARVGEFASDGGWYVHPEEGGGMGVFDLQTGVRTRIDSVSAFEVIKGTSFVVALVSQGSSSRSARNKLLLIDLRDGSERTLDDVQSYSVHEKARRVAYVARRGEGEVIEALDIGSSSPPVMLASAPKARFSALTWDKTGSALAFVRKGTVGQKQAIGLHSTAHGKPNIRWLNPEKFHDLPESYQLVEKALHVSDDQSYVLFSIEQKEEAGDKFYDRSAVRVWNARSRHLPFTQAHLETSRKFNRRMLAWWPAKDSVIQISEEPGQTLVPLTNQRFAIVVAESKTVLPDGYELDYVGRAADIYIVDLSDGHKELILARQNIYRGMGRNISFSISPGGRYIAYVKDSHWWIYDIEAGSRANVSAGVGHPIEYLKEGEVAPGPLYWTENDAGVLFRDEYDLWQSSLDGQELKRVTSGREDGIRYSVSSEKYVPFISSAAQYFVGGTINTGQDVALMSFGTDTKKSGYSIWRSEGGITDLVFGDIYVDFVVNIPTTSKHVYRRQRFDLPPELVLRDSISGEERTIAKSNAHHSVFKWGNIKLVKYRTSTGKHLEGILYYPAGYHPGKKYPMIVDIYEEQSRQLHQYINPSLTGYTRVANFMLEGYFVFRPDITYTINDPGRSAVDCVVSGVEQVLSMGVVNPNSVGLMGHSFGGYEAAYIITHTDLFAAALAGAPVTDLVSFYLKIENMAGRAMPSLFRFEKGQFRMTAPFHSAPEKYISNSPVYNAMNINTPLLTWVGGKDWNVPPSQAFEMFTLLRRLGKEHILLEYPEDGHVTREKSSIDLNRRTSEWFAHYLKGKPAKKWMKQGVSHDLSSQ